MGAFRRTVVALLLLALVALTLVILILARRMWKGTRTPDERDLEEMDSRQVLAGTGQNKRVGDSAVKAV